MAEKIISNDNGDTVVFCGTLVHSTNASPMIILQDQVIGVQKGKIIFVKHKEDLQKVLDQHCLPKGCVKCLTKYQFLMPGLIDTHIHAPQYVYTGTALDLPLLDWLNRYTFPTEAKFSDLEFATYAYNKVVRRTLRCGTTTASYFATIHKESSLRLAEIAADLGQRAFIGKVNADQNSPPNYVETLEQSLKDTEWFIEKIKDLNNPLIAPIITPRFAISCSRELMTGLGELAKKHNLRVQSHISENRDEVKTVLEFYPDCKNYTDVYDKCGLMTDKTLMAHCIYLDDEEIQTFKDRGSAMSHCACSNFSLRSGVMDCRKMKESGVKLGLGTDVSGGYNPSMFDAIRDTITASNVQSIQHQPDRPYKHLDFREVFQLATLGGSKVLGIDSIVGSFEVGKEFDALLVTMDTEDSPFDIFQTDAYRDSLEDMIQKFLFLGDDRNIEEVYVCGRRVKPFMDEASKLKQQQQHLA
ncbi:guanine deaminase-like isoform X1 [Lytechinus variegatus]|uniref:guanine deaminase-like isoform X1 n=1 Tax=Lytechinus variegatus TaxID=7654 RepID=UPI001BB11E73|nr:guanine deaminase-like isoform X1 [Lytechinus variegatus]